MKKLFPFLFLILLLVSGCWGKDKAKSKNVLQVALSSRLSTLDPALSYDTVSAQVVYQIHETLYEYDYLLRPYTLRPLLAKEMPAITDNGKTYTIKLKEGVIFHEHEAFSGKRELTAQDFITQIKRLAYLPTQSNGWWLFENKVIGLDEFREKARNLEDLKALQVEGLKALNKHELQIKLKAPYPQLIFALAMSFTAPVPIELVLATENDLSAAPIGTGPFQLREWNKNLAVELDANKNYRQEEYPKAGDRIAYARDLLKDAGKKIPFLKGIKFHVMPEARPRMQNFLKKNIHFVTLTKDYFQAALNYRGELSSEFKKKKVELQIVPTLTYWWLAFNMQDDVVGKNLKLRQAIAHAVNNERLIELFTQNIAQKANSIFPPGVPGYDPSAELPYSYNPAKARALLREAGFPDGKGLPTLRYDIRGTSNVSRQMGEFIKNELGKIGIELEVIVNSFPGFLRKAKNGDLQFWQGGWSLDYPDSHNIVQLLASANHPPGPNTSYYSNPVVDKLYDELSQGKNNLEIAQLMKKVEEQVNKDLPWAMQYYSRDYVLYHKELKNFRQSDLIYNLFKYVRLE